MAASAKLHAKTLFQSYIQSPPWARAVARLKLGILTVVWFAKQKMLIARSTGICLLIDK